MKDFIVMVGWVIFVALSPILTFVGALGLASGGAVVPYLTSLVLGLIGLALAFNWKEGK